MMLTLLVAALVGDLVLLPALSAGPLGKYFCPKPNKGQPAPADAIADQSQLTREPAPAVLQLEQGVAKAETKHSVLRRPGTASQKSAPAVRQDRRHHGTGPS